MSAKTRQRGLTTAVNLIILLAALGIVYAIYLGIAGSIKAYGAREYARGKSDQVALQKKADEDKRAKDARDQAGDRHLVAGEVKAAQTADASAAQTNTTWKESRNAARRKGIPLAGIAPSAAGSPAAAAGPDQPPLGEDPAAAADVVVRPAGRGIRVTWEFVREYDAAWVGEQGKSLFGDRREFAETPERAVAALSPFTVDDVLDNHGDNAQSCSADRRTLARLIKVLDELEEKWDRDHPGGVD
jgi:hypothetical protein